MGRRTRGIVRATGEPSGKNRWYFRALHPFLTKTKPLENRQRELSSGFGLVKNGHNARKLRSAEVCSAEVPYILKILTTDFLKNILKNISFCFLFF